MAPTTDIESGLGGYIKFAQADFFHILYTAKREEILYELLERN